MNARKELTSNAFFHTKLVMKYIEDNTWVRVDMEFLFECLTEDIKCPRVEMTFSYELVQLDISLFTALAREISRY